MSTAKIGQIGSVKVRLAGWVETPAERYQRRYIPVDPQDDRTIGNRFGLIADDQIKVWQITSWRGGEGQNVWDPERRTYRKSTRVRPTRIGDGLILGPFLDDVAIGGGASTVVLRAVGVTGVGTQLADQQVLAGWEPTNEILYAWDPVDEHLDLEDSNSITNAVDTVGMIEGFNNKTWMLSNLAASSATEVVVYDSSTDDTDVVSVLLTELPIFKWWRDRLFYVSFEDLWELDSPAAASSDETQRSDISPAFSASGFSEFYEYQRIAAGDVGPIWYWRNAIHEIELWEYNVAEDSAYQIGTLPVKFAQPTRMFYAFGFLFVAFRARARESGVLPDDGEAYVYYQRGSQRGVAGPLRSDDIDLTTTGHWHHLPHVVGLAGDELLVTWAAGLWAYNLTEGAIYHLGLDDDNDKWAYQSAFIDPHIILANSDDGDRGTANASYYNLREYTTQDANLDSGIHDFQYPGLDKTLLDVTVETDPLPANTSVQVAISVDGGSFTTLSGTHNTDNATSFTFTASSSSTTVRGKTFEIRLILSTTDKTTTPTVRGVSARATGSAHRIEWVLEVDAGDVGEQSSSALIDALETLVTNRDVVSFVDPWQNPDHEAGDTYDVTVEEVVVPEEYTEESGEVSATVRLRAVSLV